MPATLVLVHGWGFGPGVWRPTRRGLQAWPTRCLDLGFHGHADNALPSEGYFIAIGHSLGFLWLTRYLLDHPEQTARCLGLVAINGFCRFTRAPDFPKGVAPRILERMAARLSVDPQSVLRDFQRQGGLDTPLTLPSTLNPQALTLGLAWLAEWDTRALLLTWEKPLLVIASQDDQVVTPEMISRQFQPGAATTLDWWPSGGHLLPLTRPEALAERIDFFAQASAS
ncbi:MAG: alpha/beta fold hydrolase [Magnetococcales bacterium]|nr:alpha/beta fold hydrolase [Magnetococcales bacterium]